MNKEELIKISRENLRKSKQGSLCECYDEAFIKGYELSKKRIAELEYQLTHRNCLDCSNHSSNLRMRNLDLEKENAELKADYEVLSCSVGDFGELQDKLEEEQRKNNGLEEKISVLLSCKNCPENKGGYICVKEYENKCLAQKIQYIKELKEENAELKARIDNLKDEFEYSENYSKRVQKERHRLVNDNAKLREQLTKAKEIIREVMNWYWETDICSDSMPPELRQKAEQFLSEVEK